MNDGRLFDDAPRPAGDPSMIPNTPVPTGKHHPWTSHAAAKKAKHRAGSDAAAVLAFIKKRGLYGATDDEVRDGTDVHPGNVTPRRNGLMNKGLIVASDRHRPSRRNEPSTVWIAAEFANGGGA